jgi:hypothetical protein
MALGAVAAGLVVVVVLLLRDLLGFKRLPAGRRWQGYGILLELAGILLSAFAEQRGWPIARLRELHSTTLASVLVGTAVLATGLAIQFRAACRLRAGT